MINCLLLDVAHHADGRPLESFFQEIVPSEDVSMRENPNKRGYFMPNKRVTIIFPKWGGLHLQPYRDKSVGFLYREITFWKVPPTDDTRPLFNFEFYVLNFLPNGSQVIWLH